MPIINSEELKIQLKGACVDEPINLMKFLNRIIE